jgi:hypothetical protein
MSLNLSHLNHLSCPICGSRLVREEQDQQHSNGDWNERQDFACGFSHVYSPNHGKRVSKDCPNDPKVEEKERKRQLVRNSLRELLGAADVDEEFKKHVATWGWPSYIK